MKVLKYFELKFVAIYTRLWKVLCLYILENMKMSSLEKEYVKVDAPQIIQQYLLHDLYSTLGGCAEGRNALDEALRLESVAKQKLTNGKVSEVRQKFLRSLLFSTNSDYLKYFPPRKIVDVRRHFEKQWNNRTIHMIFRSLARF